MSETQDSAAPPPQRRRWRIRNPSVPAEVALWMSVFFIVVCLPVVAAMWPIEATRPKGVSRDLASALGYVGVSMIGVLFLLTARLRRATQQFGIDVVFHFHRWFAMLALGVIVFGHVIPVLMVDPLAVPSVAAFFERKSLVAGGAALLMFGLLAAWSLARRRLEQIGQQRKVQPPPKEPQPSPKEPVVAHWTGEYDHWRWGHALIAPAAYILMLWHVLARAPSLDSDAKKLFWIAYAVAGLALMFWVRVVRPTRRSNRRWSVVEVRADAPRVWTLRLKAEASSKPLPFDPGQFVWLTMRASRYAMREHPFSIGSAAQPGGASTIELTIDAVGDFTRTLEQLEPGETVWLDGPFGRFTPAKRPKAQTCVLIAGGIGIVPFMSVLRTADRHPQALGPRRYVLMRFTNQSKPVIFSDEIARLEQRMNGTLTVVPVQTSGERGKKYIDADFVRQHLPDCASGSYEFFLCGPVPLMDQAEAALQAAGVSGSRIHQELFKWV